MSPTDRLKILFLHKQILYPRDTGGKIRVLNLLRHLAKWHDITYVANLRPGEEVHLPAMEALGLRCELVAGESSGRGGARFYAEAAGNLASRYPFTVSRNYDPRLRAKLAQLLADEPYDLLVCDTVVMSRHAVGLAAPAGVLFQHNVEAQILKRHADTARGTLKRRYMRGQWRRMARFEQECGRHYDAVVAVSELDKALFERDYGWNHVHAIGTAVDEEFFSPGLAPEDPGRVLFLGSMDWMPNQDGVRWFVREVWPAVRSACPAAAFHVVGRNPPAEVRGLASAAGVTVVGGVPDVRPHLAAAAVVVVPLLVGGGTRLKIYEAMATGRAVVSTGIGAEGLPIVSGEHYIKADDPAAFAAAVVGLLQSPAARRTLGQAADDFVRRHCGSEPVARQFEAVCRGVVGRRRAAGAQ